MGGIVGAEIGRNSVGFFALGMGAVLLVGPSYCSTIVNSKRLVLINYKRKPTHIIFLRQSRTSIVIRLMPEVCTQKLTPSEHNFNQATKRDDEF